MDHHNQVLALYIPKDRSLHLVHVAAAAPCFDIQRVSAGGARVQCLLAENLKVLTFCCRIVRRIFQEVGDTTLKLEVLF